MEKMNNFTINLELTTETTVFLKASKCIYFLVFITVYILFHYSYKSIFIVKMFIFTIITRKHSVKHREKEKDADAAKLKRAETSVAN